MGIYALCFREIPFRNAIKTRNFAQNQTSKIMKRLIVTILAGFAILMSASAQFYPNGRPIPPSKRFNHYSTRDDTRQNSQTDDLSSYYLGFRAGLGISTVNSESEALDANETRAGLNIGLAVGTRLTEMVPLYFESGVYYTQKGGKSTYSGSKFTYSLNYIEIPLLLKYRAPIKDHLLLEPFIGGYLSCGVDGKIKDYGQREAYSSFSNDYSDNFNRFDGGIKLGCGLSIDLFYIEASYDIGLANVGKDNFDDTHTGDLNLTVGINF